jgi:hypothetical protein
MATALIQRSGPARTHTRAGLSPPAWQPWRTPDYDVTTFGRQARRTLTDREDRVSRLAGGWARIVWDLLRAVRAAKLDPLECSLFFESIEQSWRPPSLEGGGEAVPFRLDLADLSRHFECDRTRLRSALGRLRAKRILIDAGDDRLAINKDYREWMAPDGSSLLSPEQVKWAVSIGKTAIAAPRRRHNRPLLAGGASRAVVADLSTPCLRGAPSSLSFSTPPEASPQTPIEEAGARLEELRQKDEITRDAREGAPDAQNDAPESVARWARERISGRYSITEDLHELLPLQVERWMRDERYSALEVKTAIVKALGYGPRPSGFIGYTSGILASPRMARSAESGQPNGYTPRLSKAERDAARFAAQRATIKPHDPEEEDDGSF